MLDATRRAQAPDALAILMKFSCRLIVQRRATHAKDGPPRRETSMQADLARERVQGPPRPDLGTRHSARRRALLDIAPRRHLGAMTAAGRRSPVDREPFSRGQVGQPGGQDRDSAPQVPAVKAGRARLSENGGQCVDVVASSSRRRRFFKDGCAGPTGSRSFLAQFRRRLPSLRDRAAPTPPPSTRPLHFDWDRADCR